MVLDTSAIAAILFSEPERARFVALLDQDPNPKLSAATLVEASLVVEGRLGVAGGLRLDRFLQEAGITVVPLDTAQAAVARDGWRRFGRGRHPAGLNLGDCFAYALAKASGEPLLFKGEDFARTDVETVPPAG